MSQQSSFGKRDAMSYTDRDNHDVSPESRSHPQRSDGGSSRRAAFRKNEGRASGELEGSTLGSSSREGDRRTSGQRRTLSTSGFLLESLPRSNILRFGSLRGRSSVPSTGKRSAPGDDIELPKKRSPFPWSRNKASPSESAQVASESSPIAAAQTLTPPPDRKQADTASRARSGSHGEHQIVAPIVDTDSLQIVNLALNLNESRRRTASGLAPGPNARRPLSVSQPAAAPLESIPPTPAGKNAPRGSQYLDYPRNAYVGLPGASQSGAKSPVIDFLPSTAANDDKLYEFSERTLARADQARRHFELFHEYLRLLPSLPPLRRSKVTDDFDPSRDPSAILSIGRIYNPIQMIRNRKIRYREKCPIDPEAHGWNDVDRVHDWVDSIRQKYSGISHNAMQIVKLPSFQQGQNLPSPQTSRDVETTVSPPASLRRVSRTNSVKTSRPRLDWAISPAELLADVAWLEDSANRVKIVDKEGNRLYPNPMELIVIDANVQYTQQIPRLSVEMANAQQEVAPPRTRSLSRARPALEPEFKSVGRGRHKHRFRSHSHSTRSRSASSSRKRSRWDKVKMRTGSVSSESSLDRHEPSDRSRQTWGHAPPASEAVIRKVASNARDRKRSSRSKSPAAVISRNTTKTELSEPPPPSAETDRVGRQASLSSTASLDRKANPRLSFEAIDSTAPNSPVHAGYFPSIAVKLSPPPSRSPSPVKKGLRHKIVSRHERSKSKQGNRESREYEDENLDAVASQPYVPSEDQSERPPKLQPSPLPDTVSSSYFEDHGTIESRAEGFRGRKGQHLPESKLRGIFKGPGRFAEIVGNEVSKVGDMILKKDSAPNIRKSSSVTPVASDESDSEDEKGAEKRSGTKGLLKRLPTFTDEHGPLTNREMEGITPSRSSKPALPIFTSPLRQDGKNEDSTQTVEPGSPRERTVSSRRPDEHDGPKRIALSRSKTLDFGASLQSARGRLRSSRAIKDPSNPFSLTQPPVTGLAQARASPGPRGRGAAVSPGAGRAWSISGRSLHTLNDSGVPSKTEIERTRTLLLSSGIKAREITRRANSPREPPHWLASSMSGASSIPRVARIGEFDAAAQNFMRQFEMTQYSFQQSMHHFSIATSTPLRTQLQDLETLVNQTLTPRVRAIADSAEDLCVQLNTTSTLAVKSLSDALDRGVRKRRRRLRWVRRAGFVVLEWALVGMLWWVWLIVMAFKLVRGIFRGAISGARWILWL